MPFPASDAFWSEQYELSERKFYNNVFYIPGEDTIINELKYSKIYLLNDSVFDANTAIYVGALREDSNKRIWLKKGPVVEPYNDSQWWNYCNSYICDKELLLYDFSVNEGDTIKEGNFTVFFSDDNAVTVVVDKIDTILVENSPRKRISFAYYDNYSKSKGWSYWVEGIGSLNGLFFPSPYYIPTCACSGNILVGLKHHGEIKYFNDNYPSFFPTDIQHVTKSVSPISVRNTPDNSISFDFNSIRPKSLKIYNTSGVTIINQDVSGQLSVVLNLNSIESGVYIYCINDENDNSHRGKFVIK